MRNKLKIIGLDCPTCANKLESEINKLKQVKDAKINFSNQTLTFDCEDFVNSKNAIINLTKKIEPDVRIIDFFKDDDKKNSFEIILLMIGILVGIIVMFVNVPIVLFWIIFLLSVSLIGYKIFIKAYVLLLKGIVNENFLVVISVIGAIIIGEYFEGFMVISLFSIGKLLENLALSKSRKEIEKLTKFKQNSVIIFKNGIKKEVNVEDVNVGDYIFVRPGEMILLDGIVVDGGANLNLQSLTGESVPVFVENGKEVLSGSIVNDGILTIKVTSKFRDSTIKKIFNLIENASERKSKTETIISRIAKYYTVTVICCAVLICLISFFIKSDIQNSIYKGLIFLLISCPCAFAISIPLSYFSGIGIASKNGILIKGSNYLDALSKIKIVAFDKTGTLTTGNFIVKKVYVYNDLYHKEDILWLASLGEQYSKHSLAKAILMNNKKSLKDVKNVKEIAGKGMTFEFAGKEYFVGKDDSLSETAVSLFENQVKIGSVVFEDEIKKSSFEAISQLNNSKIKTILLSGDSESIVKKTAKELKINDYYSNMLPQSKYFLVENERKNGVIAFVGDGINDAPSLSVADVGVSMGLNGSDASIESSDVVLTDDNPNKIIKAINISKFTKKIVFENIYVAGITKILFLLLGSFGLTTMFFAVFADVGVTILTILNSLRILKIK